MNRNIENILNELYALDPTLQERGADVRLIVEALFEATPEVVLDSHFVESLRTKLTHKQELRTEGVATILPLWMLRLSPIAAIALIVLILVPQSLTTRDESGITPAQLELQYAPTSPESDSAENQKRTGNAPTADMFSMEMALDSAAFPLEVLPQQPGKEVAILRASFVTPGFLVIYEDNNGEEGDLVGVSMLIEGDKESFEITLERSMQIGEAFHAVLYADNGDGRFTPLDIPMEDTNGLPIAVLFMVDGGN